MSGSVSPLPWTGNKGCIYTTIDAFMPPHRTYALSEAALASMDALCTQLENMEVYENAVN